MSTANPQVTLCTKDSELVEGIKLFIDVKTVNLHSFFSNQLDKFLEQQNQMRFPNNAPPSSIHPPATVSFNSHNLTPSLFSSLNPLSSNAQASYQHPTNHPLASQCPGQHSVRQPSTYTMPLPPQPFHMSSYQHTQPLSQPQPQFQPQSLPQPQSHPFLPSQFPWIQQQPQPISQPQPPQQLPQSQHQPQLQFEFFSYNQPENQAASTSRNTPTMR